VGHITNQVTNQDLVASAAVEPEHKATEQIQLTEQTEHLIQVVEQAAEVVTVERVVQADRV
jgi:hypothetical protein